MAHDELMLIDGKLVPAGDGATFPVVNPATEEVAATAPNATGDDVDAAIGAARRAFDDTQWATDPAFRRHCLEQLQNALVEERELFREEIIEEAGSPRMLTYGPQLDTPLDHAIPWALSQLDAFPWVRDEGIRDSLGVSSHQYVVKEPVGVVAGILPWNFPFEILMQKVAAPLVMGNTVVIKSAPDTPLHTLRLARLVAERTDIPAGVLNIVTPSSNEVAERLVRDPRVDLVSFTGSTAVGQHIVQVGAATMKRTSLELGGKSASVVLDDSDLEQAMAAGTFACAHAGQGCGLNTRVLIARSRYDEALSLLEQYFAGVRVGDPNDPEVLTGPLINAKQRDRVLGYIARGRAEGARVAFGGGSGRPAGLERGFYVEPTLFVDVDNSMAIAREEIFGPVLVAIPFEDDADAIRIANDSPYGLCGAVWGSPDRAVEVARRIRTGALAVNGGGFYSPNMPFGGYKSSGVGRSGGLEGLEQLLETKAMAVPPGAEGALATLAGSARTAGT
jgi:aldehyde dehydrogenase (NAD+)